MSEIFYLLIIVFLVFIIIWTLYRHYKEIEEKAEKLFEDWRKIHLEDLRREYEEMAKSMAANLFNQWKMQEEENIRKDAIEKSASTIMGKVGEHLAPLLIFKKYNINPKDFRFIGSPIDFIAFKGLSEGNVEKIIFFEVKSGKSKVLSDRESAVKNAVELKKVEWQLFDLASEIQSINEREKEDVH